MDLRGIVSMIHAIRETGVLSRAAVIAEKAKNGGPAISLAKKFFDLATRKEGFALAMSNYRHVAETLAPVKVGW